MKTVANKPHKCCCCGGRIESGEDCYPYLDYPEKRVQEYSVKFECRKCAIGQVCRKEGQRPA